MADAREIVYRQMLINLDKMITPKELSTMKFQCKAARIGNKNRDKIETSLDLWEKLEERGFLGVDKLSFLKDLLKHCTDNRTDLLQIVTQFEQYHVVDPIGSTPEIEDLTKEIHFLVENLGRDWKFFMRALGLPESKLELCVESNPRNVREQIYMAFKEWRLCNPTKKDILNALKEIHRNDLHYELTEGQLR